MKIKVKVKPNSSISCFEELGEGSYLVYLKSAPKNNKANIELIKMLSKHFCVPVGRIKIKSGLTSRNKIVEVL